MKARGVVALVLELLLGLAVVGVAMNVSEHARGARLEVGRVRLGQLDDSTRSWLAQLDDQVFLTYYVSPREAMPSHLRRLERQVTDLLDAMKAASNGRLDYQIVDPTSDPELETYAARNKVAPVRVRHVTRDAYSEQEIWSTLTMAYGPGAPAVIPGLGNEHLPRLQALVVAQLQAMKAPREPVYAFAAPAGFEGFAGWLAERGDVRRVDLDAGDAVPESADILFWMDPQPVDAARLDELDALLDAGRTVVIAGSRRVGRFGDVDGLDSLLLGTTGYRGEALWGHYGLRTFDGLVFDERCQVFGDPGVPAPHRINCIANNQDFHSLAFEPNGNLVFELPSTFVLDGDALAAGGWTPEVLGTTSELTWTQSTQADSIPFALLTPEAGSSVPKQPVMVALRPEDPWRGSMVGLASSSPFRDELFGAPGTAHERLALSLLQTFASPDRLVLASAEIVRPEAVPAISPAARGGWRLFCVGLLPVLLAVVALVRSRGVPPVQRGAAQGWWRVLLPRALFGMLAVALLGMAADPVSRGLGGLLGAGSGQWDLTADDVNQVHPYTGELAARVAGAEGLQVEVFLSDRSRLAPEVRRPSDRLLDVMREVGVSAGEGFDMKRTRPEDLEPGEQEALAVEDIEALRVTSQRDEVTEVRTAWSSLRLRSGERQVLLQFPNVASYDNAEFRLAMALHELSTGRRPHLAFASDTPRLSAAERHRYYQTQGLISPQGKDEYSQARELLELAGFRVTHVDPERGRLPDDIDALIWLQPRRPMERMLESTVGHLYRGGRVLLAAQHFNIQPQQFRGANFEFVYWPRPQTTDVETLWFPEVGIQLVREVLFDTESLPVVLESQVNVTERRDFKSMRSALPFLVRAAASRFNQSEPSVAALGDQAFIGASFLEWDEALLQQHGLRATTLMTTSPDAWTYAWSGGFLPDEMLIGPLAVDAPDGAADGALDETGEETAAPQTRGPLALGALFEGQFPWPRDAFYRANSSAEPEPYLKPEPSEEAASGTLLFLTCSELFKDARLAELAPQYRGDQLLLDAVASLALEPELAAIVARRPVVRGFGRLPEEQRTRWRAAVILGAPAAYFLMGLFRAFARWRRSA